MSFIGSYQLGQSVPLLVRTYNASGTPAVPDDVPTVKVFDSASALMVSYKLPPQDRFGATGWFLLPVFLDGKFSAGNYMAEATWAIGVFAGMEFFTFDVAPGGNVDGAVIAMHNYERPHGKHLVMQLDSGSLVSGRNPRI